MNPDSRLMFVDNLQRVVETCPERQALQSPGGEVLSYRRLWEAVMVCHQGLVHIPAPAVIGLKLPRSIAYVIALLSCWRAGHVAVPLDPAWPRSRMETMIKRGGISHIVSACRHAYAPGLDVQETGVACSLRDPFRRQHPAYVIFTSGSTGTPKAVLVGHRGLCPMLNAQIRAFGIGEHSRLWWMHETVFDASMSDLGCGLLSGACLIIAPGLSGVADLPGFLYRQLREVRATHVDLPPALLAYMDPRMLPDHLGTVMIGGDVPWRNSVRLWARHKTLINIYGPTEATVCTSMIRCGPDWERPFIGHPITGMEYLVEAGGGDDSQGELIIGGDGVALGYLDQPELTHRKFFSRDGKTYYRSGDLVKRHGDGMLEFIGRKDRQFKIHGRLMNPQEVEAVMAGHPFVKRAVVLKSGQHRRGALVAFVEAAADLSLVDLRRHLRETLPAWMVPHRIHPIKELPFNAQGKTDYAALLRYHEQQIGQAAAGMTLEEKLTGLFARVLQKAVLATDDFFDQGGDSMALVELLYLARQSAIVLQPQWIYRHASPRALANQYRANQYRANQYRANHCKLADGTSGTGLAAARLRDCVSMHSYFRGVGHGLGDAVLLTGAGGFLGGYVLYLLLRQSTASVYCLLRSALPEVFQRLARRGLYVSAAQKRRVFALRGDVTQPRFGLSPYHWGVLRARAGRIYHCAAEVNLVKTYDALKAVNVDCLDSLAALMAGGCHKQLHYASTLSVFVDAAPLPDICMEKDLLDNTRTVYGGYAQSKWVAEKVLQTMPPRLGQVFVYRFGLLTADSVHACPPRRDWFSMFVQGLAGGQDGWRASAAVDISPVDQAAAAMVAISRQNRHGTYHCFHIANATPTPATTLVQCVDRVVAETGAARRDGNHYDHIPSFSRPLQGDNHSPMNLFKAGDTRFDMRRSQNALRGTGWRLPHGGVALLQRYVRGLLAGAPTAAGEGDGNDGGCR